MFRFFRRHNSNVHRFVGLETPVTFWMDVPNKPELKIRQHDVSAYYRQMLPLGIQTSSGKVLENWWLCLMQSNRIEAKWSAAREVWENISDQAAWNETYGQIFQYFHMHLPYSSTSRGLDRGSLNTLRSLITCKVTLYMFLSISPWRRTGGTETNLYTFLTLALGGGNISDSRPGHFLPM
jgi:hypothetical protein